ncbi:MAG TPA: hypothetical protein VK039_00245, partial [Brevibacterium sp.]|nr:hypothetical protein [Brevibacterium sp.]
IDGTIDETRAGTVFGVNNRWQVTDAVSVDFGYERTEGLVLEEDGDTQSGGQSGGTPLGSLTTSPGATPPGTPPGAPSAPTAVHEAWNASISFAPELPYRLGLVYSTSADDGRTRQHLRLSAVGQLAEDWSVSAELSASTLPSASGGGEWNGRQRQNVGLAYRPVHNSRLNALFAYEREVSERPKAAGGGSGAQSGSGGRGRVRPAESQTFSAEASWWATSTLEIAGKIARRNVATTSPPAPEVRTSTTLYQARGTVAFAPRWDATFIYRTLQQHPTAQRAATLYQAGYQASVGYAFIEADPRWRLEAGYRYADFAPEDDPSADAFVEGPFVRLTYRF